MTDNTYRRIPKGYYLHIPKGRYTNIKDFIRDLYVSIDRKYHNPSWVQAVYDFHTIQDVYILGKGSFYEHKYSKPSTDFKQYFMHSLGGL